MKVQSKVELSRAILDFQRRIEKEQKELEEIVRKKSWAEEDRDILQAVIILQGQMLSASMAIGKCDLPMGKAIYQQMNQRSQRNIEKSRQVIRELDQLIMDLSQQYRLKEARVKELIKISHLELEFINQYHAKDVSSNHLSQEVRSVPVLSPIKLTESFQKRIKSTKNKSLI